MKYKIRQQKQIDRFLVENIGEREGNLIYEKESKMLNTIIEQVMKKTKTQRKTLTQTILPRIAMYKTFLSNNFSNDETTMYMRKYMFEIIAGKKHSAMTKMEWFPGFYHIYSKVFLKIMRTTDLQESTQNSGRNFYDVTITNCLWHSACVDNGCEELCSMFCDVDDITFGGLKKIGFSRTQTLGYGGSCCDFHFFKK